MPASVAIPMLIGAGVSAGTSIYAANKGANAARSSAAQQQQGVNRALDLQQQSFNTVLPMVQQGQMQAQQAYSPYQQMGGAALNALYQRLGIGGGAPMPYGGPSQMMPMPSYGQRPAMPMMPPQGPPPPPPMQPPPPQGGVFGHPMGGQMPQQGPPPPGMMPMASLGLRR